MPPEQQQVSNDHGVPLEDVTSGSKRFLIIGVIVTTFVAVLVVAAFFYVARLSQTQHNVSPEEANPVTQTTPAPINLSSKGCYALSNGKIIFENSIIADADPNTFVDLVKNEEECYGKDANNVYFANEKIPEADPHTFKVLDKYFAKDEQHVFVRDEILVSADAETFQVLDGSYAKDKNNVYLFKSIIPEADTATFVALNASFGKDSQGVFFGSVPIDNADPDSFIVLNENFGKDAKSVYGPGCWYEGLPDCVEPLEGVDPETFVVFDSFGYVKDKNAVYYTGFGFVEIPEADPNTFSAITQNYGKDAAHVFLMNTALDNLEPDSFAIIGDGYVRDDNGIYYIDYATNNVSDADPESFKTLGGGYAKDVNYAYFEGKKISSTDTLSFITVGYSDKYSPDFAKDTRAVYQRGKVVSGADPNTFKVLDHAFALDRNRVYFHGLGGISLVSQANPDGFVSLGSYYGKDKSNVYYQTAVVPNADVNSFTIDNSYYGGTRDGDYDAQDKDRRYKRGEPLSSVE